MHDHTPNNSLSDKSRDLLSQILKRLAALEDIVGGTRIELGAATKTQASQTSQSDIHKGRFKTDVCSEMYKSELMKTVNFPGTSYATGDKNRKFHIFLWIFIQIFALLISVFFIKDAYITWKSSPIVIYQSNELKSVKDIEAPAITICFPTGMTEEMSNKILTSLEECLNCVDTATMDHPFLRSCSFNEVCDRNILYSGLITKKICEFGDCTNCTELDSDSQINEDINGSLYSNFQQLLPVCESLPSFTIRVDSGEPVRGCDDKNIQWFVSSNDKLCMSYNSRHYRDIYRNSVVLSSSVDTHLISGIKHTAPSINSFKNVSFHFEDYDDAHSTKFFNCHASYSEPTVYVHNPGEIPLQKYLDDDDPVTWDSYYIVQVTPHLISADQGIRDKVPRHRNCYFPYERELILYQSYSRANCEVECLVNCSMNSCNCVPFDLPRPNASVNVCFKSYCDTDCDCECLPDCESLIYSVDYKEKPNPQGNSTTDIKLVVLFKTKEVRPQVRYNLASFSEFVAYSLGVLGTFNGLSVIALWRLVYLLMLKLWNLGLSYFCKRVPTE